MASATGKNGVLSFDGRLIGIQKGSGTLGSFFQQGIQGDRTIVARSVTAVEFRDIHKNGNGFISFDFPGKNPPRGGAFDAMADENAVVFTPEQRDEFVAIRDEIVSYLADVAAGYEAILLNRTEAV